MSLYDRVTRLNDAPIRDGARHVLYWARTNRRTDSNHALSYALELAGERNLPVVFREEPYPSPVDRFQKFVKQAAHETKMSLDGSGIRYAYGSIADLARGAAAVVTDDHPLLTAPPKLEVACFAVDSSCIVPVRTFEKREYGAYTIRPKIRKVLDKYLQPAPKTVAADGSRTAVKQLDHFLEHNLHRYSALKNEPSAHATSGLSPYLHFGHISSLEVALKVRDYAAKHGLMADEFLEELIVRRELAFNYARFAKNPESFDNLPDWARQTLHEHVRDKRKYLYSRDDFMAAETHDPLWNATQKEMLATGKIHGYYRMYWGKKVLEWSRTPEEAVETMVHIHDHWALDGRDPCTYANILWCLGLHDRPWPERPIFGKVRYMSYEGMRRKTDVDAYIREIGEL